MPTHFFKLLRWAPLAVTLVIPTIAQAQLAPDWSASVPAHVPAPALAVDGNRNSVLAATLTGQPVTVHKFGPSGAVLWQRSLTTASRAFDVATDAAGNTVLAGVVVDATGLPVGTLVAKLDAAGNLLWQSVDTTASAQARELALDSSGNIYAMVQAGTAAGPEAQLVKLNASGARLWSRSFGASTLSGLDSLVINSAGQAVVTGNNSAGQAVVAAFDALGNPLASINTALGTLSLAAGRSGEVYAVGSSGTGFLAIKYGAAFNELWRVATTNGGGALRAAVDANGNLVMTGSFNVASSGAFGGASITPNWRTVKLSPTGVTLWSVDDGYAQFSMGNPAALGLGIDGSVFVTGRSAEPVTDATGAVSFYRQSMATLKYGVTGALLGKVYTSSSQSGADVEVASDGGVHVVGESSLVNGTPAPLLHFAAPVLAPARPSALLVTGLVYESGSALATVTVSTAAGVTVNLSSSNTSAAKVPATVVVPAGATSATFTITTLAVRRHTAATIRASANGTTLGTTITVLNR